MVDAHEVVAALPCRLEDLYFVQTLIEQAVLALVEFLEEGAEASMRYVRYPLILVILDLQKVLRV